MRALTLAGAAVLALSGLSGCASTQPFSGTVTTTDAAAFAPDATLQVTLMDAASGAVVARKSVAVAGRGLPIPFTFTPTQPLAADGRYQLSASVIGRTGQLLYRSMQPVTVSPSSTGAITVTVQAAGS